MDSEDEDDVSIIATGGASVLTFPVVLCTHAAAIARQWRSGDEWWWR